MLINRADQAKFKRGNYYSLFGLMWIVIIWAVERKDDRPIPFWNWIEPFLVVAFFVLMGYLILYQILMYLLEE